MDEEVEEPQPQPASLLDHLAGAGDTPLPPYEPGATAAHDAVEPVEPELGYEPEPSYETAEDAPVAYEPEPAYETAEAAPLAYEPGEYDTAEYAPVEYQYEAETAEAEAEAEAEDDEEDAKKRVPLGTKVLLVGAAWVLLTFFLIGAFNKDGKNDDSVRLSQAPGAATAGEESAEDGGDGTDGSDGSGGDGVEEGDADATVEAYPGRSVSGRESGSAGAGSTAGGSTGGGSTGGSTGGTGGTGGTAGGGSSGGSTATTARSGGGGTGGSSTSTTAAPGGGGGGGGGGGSPSTTVTTAPGSSTTTTTAPAESVTIRSTDFSRDRLTISKGETVEFYNSTDDAHSLKIEDNPTPVVVLAGARRTVTFNTKGKFRVESTNLGHTGHLDVTVS